MSFWQSRDFVDWTQLCCSSRPSALRWVGGDRSSPSPTATGQPPGPTGRAAHLWAKSSPVPYIVPWIQTAQDLGWRGRGCKGCGFLCEVSSFSSATRFRSLPSKVRPEILEAATESGTRVATPAFHLFLVAAICPSKAFRKYIPNAVPAHLNFTIFFLPHSLRFAFTNFSQCTVISYFLTFSGASPNIDLYSGNIFFLLIICSPYIFTDPVRRAFNL